MAKLTMDWHGNGVPPRRGDELAFPSSTYYVLWVRQVKRRDPAAGLRFAILALKQADIEDRLWIRLCLMRAKRGYLIHQCTWNSRKKKKYTFEQLMQIRGDR